MFKKSISHSINPLLRGAVLITVLAGGLPALAHDSAHHGKHKKPATFSIIGKGVIAAEPDVAHISAGVVTQADSAEVALSENSAKVENVFKQLEAAGIERRHIQTSSFSVNPRYANRPHNKGVYEAPKIIGYTVRNQVTVKISELAKTGRVLAELTKVGANELGGIQFSVSKRAALLDQARAAAVADAKRKALIYMDAAGVKLGRLLAISEAGARRPNPRRFARAASLEAVAVPVAAGEQEISVTVNMTWEISE